MNNLKNMTPQNDFERALLKDLEEGKREGKLFEIYPN